MLDLADLIIYLICLDKLFRLLINVLFLNTWDLLILEWICDTPILQKKHYQAKIKVQTKESFSFSIFWYKKHPFN